MKKILIICAIGLLPLVALADQNPIKMTTFFPAPYAAFSRLNALNTGGGFWTDEGLVVGLSSSPNCKLSLGCNEVSSNPLATSQTVVSSGDLYLNGEDDKLVIEATGAITVGSSSSQYDEKELQFKKNAHIGTFFNFLISANFGTARINTLKIGNMAFPSCRVASGASGPGKMQWRKLTLQVDGQSANSRKGYFLTCGSGTPCDPNCFKWVVTEEKVIGPESHCTFTQCSAEYNYWQDRQCGNLGEVQLVYCCDGTGPSAVSFLYYVTCKEACDCGGNGGGSGGGIGVVPGGSADD